MPNFIILVVEDEDAIREMLIVVLEPSLASIASPDTIESPTLRPSGIKI